MSQFLVAFMLDLNLCPVLFHVTCMLVLILCATLHAGLQAHPLSPRGSLSHARGRHQTPLPIVAICRLSRPTGSLQIPLQRQGAARLPGRQAQTTSWTCSRGLRCRLQAQGLGLLPSPLGAKMTTFWGALQGAWVSPEACDWRASMSGPHDEVAAVTSVRHLSRGVFHFMRAFARSLSESGA